MTESKAISYNLLIIEANRLGRILKLLHDAVSRDMEVVLEDLYDGELDALSERLFGIGSILQLIRETPNAYINSEGMAAIQGEVEEAAKLGKSDWAKTLLEHIDPL